MNSRKKTMRILLGAALAVMLACGSLEAATIHANTIKEAVKTYIENNMPWPKGNIRVFFPAKIMDIQLPGTKVAIEVRGKRNESFIGYAYFTVSFYDEDVLLKQESVRARIEVFHDVALSTRALERDSEIKKDDVRFESRWLSEIPANAVTDYRDVVGKRITTTIRPNCEITKSILKSFPMVRRGRMVRIVLESGPMIILTSGLSEEDGGRNDIVRVKNLTSNKIIYARVVEDSMVRVDF